MTFSELTLEQKRAYFNDLEVVGRKGKESFQRWEERLEEVQTTPFLDSEQKATMSGLLEEGFESLINALGATIPTPDSTAG